MANRARTSGDSIAENVPGNSDAGSSAPPTLRHRETVEYLRSMLQELTVIARAEKLDMLAYLIGMAHTEAADVAARNAARLRPPKKP